MRGLQFGAAVRTRLRHVPAERRHEPRLGHEARRSSRLPHDPPLHGITQETVGREYFDALAQLESRYALLRTAGGHDDFDPVKALDEVARWAKAAIGHDDRRS
jgi:hypothetical protein